MTDELLPPDRTLASAALDNEVTADERAQVESTPALRDERDFYAGLSVQLRDVEVPAGARDNAIAAALAAFDAPAEAHAAASQRVVSIAERRARRARLSPWLTGAAAAAVVALVGVAALNSGGEDNDSASVATKGAAFTSAAADAAADAGESQADNGAPVSAAEAPTAAAPAETTAAAYDSDPAAEVPASAAGGVSTPLANRVSFETPQQIIDFFSGGDASATTSASADTTATDRAPSESSTAETTAPAATQAPTVAIACAVDTFAGDVPAVYRNEPVILRIRDDGSERVVDVILESTCAVVETIPLP